MVKIDDLYTSEEFNRGFRAGLQKGRQEKIPKPFIKVIEKIKVVPRKDHPRSRWLRYGIVSHGKLLNTTYSTQADAVAGLLGLAPASGKEKNIDAIIIDLGR